MKIAFFTGPQCCLCDDADALLRQSSLYEQLQITKQNIRDNTEHYHLYAVRIPVLKREDNGAELGWPFTLDELELFLK